MKISTKITKALFIFTTFAISTAFADNAYLQKANNANLDFTFSLKLNFDIFQFQGENLPSYQSDINEDLISFVNKHLAGYKDNFNDFVDDISANRYPYSRDCELGMSYTVHTDNANLLSIIVFVNPYGGGGNGSRTELKAFNYILGENPRYVSNLRLSEILRDNESYLKLLAKINEGLAKRKHPLAPTRLERLFDSTEFAFGTKELILYFRPYSVGSGADGVVEIRIKYSEIQDILSPKISSKLTYNFIIDL